jgi:adenylate kinase family enzyme
MKFVENGELVKIDGNGSVQEVAESILKAALKGFGKAV